MFGIAILLSWIGLSVVVVLLGKLCDSKLLLGIGAVMLLMTCMVSEVSW